VSAPGASWRALRTLGHWGRVVGETAAGDPIVVAGSDRLVLRRGTQSFWVADRCTICGAEMARIDLDEHQRTCEATVPDAVRQVPTLPAWVDSTPANMGKRRVHLKGVGFDKRRRARLYDVVVSVVLLGLLMAMVTALGALVLLELAGAL
jgi:hypothetical protein